MNRKTVLKAVNCNWKNEQFRLKKQFHGQYTDKKNTDKTGRISFLPDRYDQTRKTLPEGHVNWHIEEQVRIREPDRGLTQGAVEAKGRGKAALGAVPEGGLCR